MSKIFKSQVASNYDGITILEYLAQKFTYYSETEWIKQIQEKRIRINGNYTVIDSIVKNGNTLEFEIEDFIEPEVNRDFSIVYEDENLLAINKPSNLPVHPAGRYKMNNLQSILEEKGMNNLYLANRIDRETSGIVLFSKNEEFARKLTEIFSNRKIKKTYIVYVEGEFKEKLHSEGFLVKDSNSMIRKKKKFVLDDPDSSAISSETYFEKIQFKNGISKLLAYPITGRTHQIRATLYSLGFPVVGDKIYGVDENIFLNFIEKGEFDIRMRINRQALHAYSLELPYPKTDRILKIEAPEPEELLKLSDDNRLI